MKKNAIELKNVSVGYEKRVWISDVSFLVKPGKILTLIGPNGAGKSTILKTITGQLKSLGGVIELQGNPMTTLKQSEIAKQISMVMTSPMKVERMTCEDMVATGRYPFTGRFGILSNEDKEKMKAAMEYMEVTEIAQQNFKKISDGQRQRVMLARAFCQEPKVLILDEPTSYLDLYYKMDLLEKIRSFAREKSVAVVMSLHELELARQISDEILCVAGEKLQAIGTPEEIFAGGFLQKIYGIPKESFDENTGNIHLKGNKAQPQVFVIGGGGSGISVYHRLQREKIPFVAGILSPQDVEYTTAKATASMVLATKTFYPAKRELVELAKQWIDKTAKCYCPLENFGPYNRENKELRDYAIKLGKCNSKIKLGDENLENTRNQNEIGQKELLVVSFGTSYNENRCRSIGAIENAIEGAFADYSVRRAFTSRMIIERIKNRDSVVIDNVKEALERAVNNEVKNLVVQPTHLMNGLEYNDVVKAVEHYAGAFEKVAIGAPLLSTEEDLECVIKIITEATKTYDDGKTAICFMGHGTEAESNKVYAKMQEKLTKDGFTNYFVGTVEATPTLEDVLAKVQASQYHRVVLEPLMIVAGEHANHDMAGSEEESWKSTFEAAGYEVECIVKGLGEMKEIQQLFIEHAQMAMESLLFTP